MRTLSQQIRGLGKAATALGTVALTAAVFAMQRMIRTQLEVIDATTKMARSLGFTTEQLVGLEHAAGIAGVANKDLATALRRLSKNISDATLGLTTAIRAFDALGLSAKDLIDLAPHKALLLVADAMSKMQNPTERTRVALDLFGRSGVKLIELMKDGAAGLEAMQREAEALGLTFTDLEGQRVEAANDAILRMKQVFTALFRTMTIDVAPSLEKLANTIRAMVPQIASLVKSVLTWTAVLVGLAAVLKLVAIGQAIVLAFSGPAGWAILAASAAVAAAAVTGIVIAFNKASAAAEAFRKANDDLAEGTKTTAQQIAAVTREIEMRAATDRVLNQLIADGVRIGENSAHVFQLNWTRLHDLNDELGRLKQQLVTDQVNELAAAFIEQTQAIGGNTFALQLEALARAGATAAQIDMLKGLEQELELRQQLQKGVALANRLIEQSLTPLERHIKSQDLLKEAFERGLITEDKYKRALEQLAKDFNEATNEADRLRKSLEEVADVSVAPNLSKRTGDFRQVDSIRRLALQGVRSPSQQRLEDVIERMDEHIQESIERFRREVINNGIALVAK